MSGNQTKDSCPDQRRERIINRHLEAVEKFLNEDIISDFKTDKKPYRQSLTQ
jgi:hypothetical protein